MAVDDEVGADDAVVGEAEAMLGLVDDADGLEAGQLGELDG